MAADAEHRCVELGGMMEGSLAWFCQRAVAGLAVDMRMLACLLGFGTSMWQVSQVAWPPKWMGWAAISAMAAPR